MSAVSRLGRLAFKLQGFVNDPRRTQDLEFLRYGLLIREHATQRI